MLLLPFYTVETETQEEMVCSHNYLDHYNKSKVPHIIYRFLVAPSLSCLSCPATWLSSQLELLPKSACRPLRYHVSYLCTLHTLFLPVQTALSSLCLLPLLQMSSEKGFPDFSGLGSLPWLDDTRHPEPIHKLFVFLTRLWFFAGKVTPWIAPLILQVSGDRKHGRRR